MPSHGEVAPRAGYKVALNLIHAGRTEESRQAYRFLSRGLELERRVVFKCWFCVSVVTIRLVGLGEELSGSKFA